MSESKKDTNTESAQNSYDYFDKTFFPCVIIANTSESMKSSHLKLRDGITCLVNTINQSIPSSVAVDMCTVGAGNHASLIMPFTLSHMFEMPQIDFSGKSSIHAAIDLAMELLAERKAMYRQEGVRYYYSWIFLLTDGRSDDPDNGTMERLLKAQNENRFDFFPIAIGENADLETLRSCSKHGYCITDIKEELPDMFRFGDLPMVEHGQKINLSPLSSDHVLVIDI